MSLIRINNYGEKWLLLLNVGRIEVMEVFLSYSSDDENIANTISNMFHSIKHHGIELIRDKDRLSFMQDIKKFMQSIRDVDYALLIISDSYLKSNNCMYEITELVKEENDVSLNYGHSKLGVYKV